MKVYDDGTGIKVFDGSSELFYYELSGDDSLLKGGPTATDDLRIYACQGSVRPNLRLSGSGAVDYDIPTGQWYNIQVNGAYGPCITRDASNNAIISARTAGDALRLNATTGVIEIDDILLLDARTAPSNPTTGMIYFDSTNSTLCCWTGTGWKGFWD